MTVARENFLDKLKREREEAATSTPAVKEAPIELVATRPALPVLPVSIVARSKDAADDSSSSEESSSSESEDEDARTPAAQVRRAAAARPAVPAIPDQEVDEDGNLLLRKRSKAFLDNGRIRIDASSGTGAGALHVIERGHGGAGKEPKKQLVDDKSKEADKKRLESLGKMKDTYNQQKLAIKQALSGIDATSGQRSNKIVFDADPSAAQPQRSLAKRAPSAPAKGAPGRPLFDDEDDDGEAPDYGNDFRVKEQYQGERGAQLLKLQSRFKNDKRFDMDAKFLEDEGDYEWAGDEQQQQPTAEASAGNDDERTWQYGILESVMGKRIQSEPAGEGRRNQLPQTMLRYDPTKQDHTKYVAQGKRRAGADDGVDNNKAKKAKRGAAAAVEEEPARIECAVSKEQFYKVNTNLNSLTGSGAGFSLLSMFGTAEPTTIAKNTAYRETLLTANSTQKQIDDMTNPFKYDESDDEQEVPNAAQKSKESEAAGKKAAVGKVLPKKGTSAVWHETFFILDAEDERMKGELNNALCSNEHLL